MQGVDDPGIKILKAKKQMDGWNPGNSLSNAVV